MSVIVVFTLKENKDELSLCTAPPPPSPVLFEGSGLLFSCFMNLGLFHSLFHFQ